MTLRDHVAALAAGLESEAKRLRDVCREPSAARTPMASGAVWALPQQRNTPPVPCAACLPPRPAPPAAWRGPTPGCGRTGGGCWRR